MMKWENAAAAIRIAHYSVEGKGINDMKLPTG
jgi:hypothetical protein